MSAARIFKLTVYAPRSVDPTESTPLTPAAGAPHGDPFVVTTIQGVAGAKPYLDIPTARGAVIDALNKKSTVSSLTVRVLDARVTTGGSNAQRWVTAFTGDTSGGNQLLGRLVRIVESLDGGVTFPVPYYTGRISAPATAGKLWTSLALKGLEDDLDVDIFVGDPAAAVHSYARLAQITPLGLMQPVRADGKTGYAGLPVTPPLRAKVGTIEPTGTRRIFELLTQFDQSHDPSGATMTQALVAAGQAAQQRILGTPGLDPTTVVTKPPQVYIAPAADHHTAADFAAFDLVWIDVHLVGLLNPPPSIVAPVHLGSAPSSSPIGSTLGYLRVTDRKSVV